MPILNRELCNEWLVQLNVTQGMICAGYSEGTFFMLLFIVLLANEAQKKYFGRKAVNSFEIDFKFYLRSN